MAARGLISLFRTVNPKLLARKDRGRPTEAVEEGIIAGPLEFGVTKTVDFVPGAEILPEDADEVEESENEEESDSDSEWETVAHSDDEVEKEREQDDEVDDNDDEAEDGDELAEDEDGWVTDSDDEMVEDDDEEIDSEEDDESEEEEVELKKEVKEDPVKGKKLNRDQYKALRRKQRAGNEIAKVEKAKLVSETRILSDADFRKIRVHQLKKQVGATDNRKRTNADMRLEEELEEKKAR